MGAVRIPTILAFAAAALLALPAAAAEKYPARPVHFVAGFAAGGPVDIVARVMAEWLSNDLGQQFVVDNRAGSGGNIGTAAVSRSPDAGADRSRPQPEARARGGRKGIASSAQWGSELSASDVLVVNTKQDCSDSSNPAEHGRERDRETAPLRL